MLTYPVGTLAPKDTGGIPTNGLIAEWLFNGDANDTSGNGYNGTVYGASLTTDRHSNINSAYDFNGTSDYIDFGDIDFETIGTSFSISFWVKFDVLTGDRVLFHAALQPTTNSFYLAKQSDGEFRLYLQNYDERDILISVDTLNWFHFVLTLNINGSNELDVELFKNNSSIFTDNFPTITDPTKIFDESNLFFMGRLVNNSIRYHDGKLDDIRLYNRVLSSEEITALYNE